MTPSAIVTDRAATDRAATDPTVEAGTAVATADTDSSSPSPAGASTDDLVLADMLIEEISIDGMCGVY